MIIQALKPIKHNGKRYKVGELVENIDEKQAQRLINLGAATNMVAVSSVIEEKIEDPIGNKVEGTTDSSSETDVVVNSDDELGSVEDLMTDEEVFQLIWNNFKLEELKLQAEEDLKLDFAGNISKTDLIHLIIKEEKDGHFLDQIEE